MCIRDRYLDFLCGLAVTSLGHSHPRVAAALAGQAGTLLHVSTLFDTEPHLEVAARLDALVRSGTGATGPGRVLFQNSGAEGNEAAIKLARKWGRDQRHGSSEIITAENAFHGRTLTTVTATGNPRYMDPFGPLPGGFVYVPYNDIDALRGAITDQTCAIMLNSPGNPTGAVYPRATVQAICEEAARRGVVVISDEVYDISAPTKNGLGEESTHSLALEVTIDTKAPTIVDDLFLIESAGAGLTFTQTPSFGVLGGGSSQSY